MKPADHRPLPGEALTEWRSGTGRVIRVDDLVYLGTKDSVLFKVKRMARFPDRVEVHVFHVNGNRQGTARTFLVDDLHQVRRAVEIAR